MKHLLRFAHFVGAGLLLAAGLLGCGKDQEFEPAIELGTAYYPLAVNTQRTFAVADTVWAAGVPTITNFQLREAVTDTFRDASGHRAFRVERARRATAAQAWQADSVYVLTMTNETVTLLRDNRRTVELIFPVREDRGWNMYAYDGSSADTITDVSRRYHRVGQPLTLAVPGTTSKTYDATLFTRDEGTTIQDNLYYLVQQEQAYAKNVGPILRRRRIYYYCDDRDPDCNPTSSYIFKGSSRHQTLIDYGPL